MWSVCQVAGTTAFPARKRREKWLVMTLLKKREYFRRVFVPGARILQPEEIQGLTEREKSFSEISGNEGVWLELFCPDQ
jgi:hypothetical protein